MNRGRFAIGFAQLMRPDD